MLEWSKKEIVPHSFYGRRYFGFYWRWSGLEFVLNHYFVGIIAENFQSANVRKSESFVLKRLEVYLCCVVNCSLFVLWHLR